MSAIVTSTVVRLRRNALNLGTEPPPPLLSDPFQDAHVIRDCRAAHVEQTAKPCVPHLKIAGGTGELHRAEGVHRHASGADRAALPLYPPLGITPPPPHLL